MKNFFTLLAVLLIATLSSQSLNAKDISGNVLYQGDINRPIGKVTVTLTNLETMVTQTYTTANDGYYLFSNVATGNYTLTGKTTLKSGGINYMDATLVFLNMLGMYQLSPMQKLASDVDGNNSISWNDYNLIMNYLLKGTPFPAGSWKFETVPFAVTNYKDYDPNKLGGTCSGDVGGTFVPMYYNIPALPVSQNGELSIVNGESFTSRIITQKELSITGTGVIINYPAELVQIESVEFKGHDYKFNIENGQIRLIWGNPNATPINFNDGEAFVTLHGICKPAFTDELTATFSLDGNTTLIDVNNMEISKLQFASPVLKLGKAALKLSNYPNPFKTSTKLSVYTAEEGNAIIDIYSTSGKLMKHIPVTVPAGNSEVQLDGSQLSKGNYICKMRLQTATGTVVKDIKMVKAE